MVKVALVGVGNVASSLVQASELMESGKEILGIELPPKEPIEIVAAFDIDKRKVGKPLREAIFSPPNVVAKYVDVETDLPVLRGPTLDGTRGILGDIIEESDAPFVDVVSELKNAKAEVVVSLLPTGADEASRFYGKASLQAGSAFINTTPSPVAKELGSSFKAKGVPIYGDDLLSQIGGTITHAGIMEFLRSRGVKLLRSFQVDIAGTTEAMVTLEGWRKEVKKEVKTNMISHTSEGAEVVAGTSDYVSFLGDRRVSYIVIEGTYSLGVPLRIEVSLKTLDGPNAVPPLIELIGLAQQFKRMKIGGPVKEVCAAYFKSPPSKLVGR
ncbi:L-myo-inositol-1-phosphate synthase [Sulfodiicoccus acidiphilus]|uniref:L-myo-inositol-1-phosphate synthase n=1 Tax=Sulfodiicoccus acidiphilus TaxID=1670455 RepID=A0A348B0X3_9CREN|nr:L-myo-inositol-1-phosphate synthase [Sulfodiicoccus acidiphilus]BBD71825.1 L-myo-inositol-1-phosphate synthase [Sulfodiicoccus acidiphilus]